MDHACTIRGRQIGNLGKKEERSVKFYRKSLIFTKRDRYRFINDLSLINITDY